MPLGHGFAGRGHHAIPVVEPDTRARSRPHDGFTDESAGVVRRRTVIVVALQCADHEAYVVQTVDGNVEDERLVVDGMQGLFLYRGFGLFDLPPAQHEGDLDVWVCGQGQGTR